MGLDDGSMNMGRPAVAHYSNMKNDTSLESAKEGDLEEACSCSAM